MRPNTIFRFLPSYRPLLASFVCSAAFLTSIDPSFANDGAATDCVVTYSEILGTDATDAALLQDLLPMLCTGIDREIVAEVFPAPPEITFADALAVQPPCQASSASSSQAAATSLSGIGTSLGGTLASAQIAAVDPTRQCISCSADDKAAKQAEIDALEIQIAEEQTQKYKVQAELKAVAQKIKSASDQKDLFQSAIDGEKKVLDDLNALIATYGKNAPPKSLTDAKDAVESTIKKVTDEVDALKKKIDTLEKKETTLKKNEKDLSKQIKDDLERLLKLTNELGTCSI